MRSWLGRLETRRFDAVPPTDVPELAHLPAVEGHEEIGLPSRAIAEVVELRVEAPAILEESAAPPP